MPKRLFDFWASFFLLLILAPVMGLAALLIRLKLGSPVLFFQTRAGKDERPFKIVKFRTMLETTDLNGHPLSDDQRITLLGSLLRSFSVDELPGLWNVLKGDMSLVGPRPLLIEYLPKYSSFQRRRHEVKPGITGWAQINGRNAITWDEKFRLDVWYVDNRSMWLDLKILFVTVMKVIGRRNISASGHPTMPFFTGGEDER